MKKLAGILLAVLLLTTLSGCYKADTTFDFNMHGGVEVTSSLVASKATYEAAGLTNADDLMGTFAPETIEMYSAMYGMEELGERISMTRIDAQGNEIGEGTPLPEDGSMIGTRLQMRYDNLLEAATSFTLLNYLRATPLSQDESGYGLKLEEKHTLFGTKYIASGKISILSNDMYKEEYDAAPESARAELSAAENRLTFKFPFAFSKSNADSKGFFGNKLTWVATEDAPEKEVYFTVTMINPVILAMGILILLLLAAVLVLALRQKKNGPDAYFIDEHGNPISVYDDETIEEEGEFSEESFDEATEESAEEVAESVEEIAEENPENDAE